MPKTAEPKEVRDIRNPSLTFQNSKEGKAYLKPIREMAAFDRLIYWITERQKIFHARFPQGYHQKPGHLQETNPPWTQDPIFQSIFFCNVYREQDRVTAYLRDNFREQYKDDPCVFLGTILLRWFNYIPTMFALIKHGIPQAMGGSDAQKLKALRNAEEVLATLRDHEKEQIFGAAYIIKLFNGMGKMEAIMSVMRNLMSRKTLYRDVCGKPMSQVAHMLRATHGMGNFYVYQFIGDLAYTHVLKKSPDWWTWSFSGPGTSRSIHRLQGRDCRSDGTPWERRVAIPVGAEKFVEETRKRVNEALKEHNKELPPNRRLQPIHARDMTGCFCEYDKYCRALNNERDLKRGYPGWAR